MTFVCNIFIVFELITKNSLFVYFQSSTIVPSANSRSYVYIKTEFDHPEKEKSTFPRKLVVSAKQQKIIFRRNAGKDRELQTTEVEVYSVFSRVKK